MLVLFYSVLKCTLSEGKRRHVLLFELRIIYFMLQLRVASISLLHLLEKINITLFLNSECFDIKCNVGCFYQRLNKVSEKIKKNQYQKWPATMYSKKNVCYTLFLFLFVQENHYRQNPPPKVTIIIKANSLLLLFFSPINISA